MAVLHTASWNDPGGPPVVCVHGAASHAGRFRELAAGLPGDHVVAVDLRGHGRSTWQAPWTAETHLADLLETADSLGIGAATWIGHSFGGRLVAALAARRPDRVERAVLLGPAMQIEPGGRDRARQGAPRRRLVRVPGRGDRRAARGRDAPYDAPRRSRRKPPRISRRATTAAGAGVTRRRRSSPRGARWRPRRRRGRDARRSW